MPGLMQLRQIGLCAAAVVGLLAYSVAEAQQPYPAPQASQNGPAPQAGVASQLPAQTAQAPAGQQPLAQQAPGLPLPAQAPAGFQLNAIQQAFLVQVLDAWQRESGKVNTFSCSFERLEFNNAFGPAADVPLTICAGELSYSKPDKGSFEIKEIKKWTERPVPAGQPAPAQRQGDYVVQKNAIGEHWVCNGKSIFEYRHEQKQLVERPIPPANQGQAIEDGPLPFLFGTQRQKLMARYWLRVIGETQNEVWLEARPKLQADAANFSMVRVILDREKLLPKAMEMNPPDGSRHVYKFDLANASINSPLAKLGAIFTRPSKPWGYTLVVENIPQQQAAQPGPAPR